MCMVYVYIYIYIYEVYACIYIYIDRYRDRCVCGVHMSSYIVSTHTHHTHDVQIVCASYATCVVMSHSRIHNMY